MPITVNIPDQRIFASPGNWDADGLGQMQINNMPSGSTFIRTANPGAYLRLAMNSGGAGYMKLNLDTSVLNSIVAANCPRLMWSIDGGAAQTSLLVYSATPIQVQLASALAAGQHYFDVFFQGVVIAGNVMGDRWNIASGSGISAVKLTGLEVDSGSSVIANPNVRPKKMLVYGGNGVEGDDAVGAAHGVGDQDATQTWVQWVASAFNAEVGVVAYSGQGYEAAGFGNVPAHNTTWNLLGAGRPRPATITFDYILEAHGAAGVVTAGDVSGMIANLRATWPTSKIFQVQTFAQTNGATIRTGVANYQSANPTDVNVFLVDPQRSFLNGLRSNDAANPNVRGHAEFASWVVVGMESAMLQAGSPPAGTLNFTLPQLTTIFKNFGKIIYAAFQGTDQAKTYQQLLMNLNRQFADGADPTDTFSYNVLFFHDVSFQTSMNGLVAQESNGPVLAKATMDNYLLQLGPTLGAQSTDLPATIAGYLAQNLAAASGYVAPSGASDQYHSFAAYFGQNYGVTLPQNVSPVMLDSWITTTIV